MRFASSGFITAIVNPPERKLTKHNSVQCTRKQNVNSELQIIFNEVTDHLDSYDC